MASPPGTEEIRLSSRDLELLLQTGNINFENLDLLDPSLAAQIQTLTALQQTIPGANPNLNVAASKPRTGKPASMSRQSSKGQQQPPGGGPWVEIVEQPKARGLRFRYECEGRSAGSIPGENSTTEKKTFPTIKLHGHQGQAVIVVSCVSKDEPYKPHPHNLVGKDCKKGVCTLRVRDTNTITFPHLGIQCAKKKDVDGNLKQRQEINVDPFQTGFKHKGMSMDLNVVRLCFQVFLPDEHGKITRIVPPVVSQPIHDKKALNDLVICRVDRTSGKPRGGDEVFLLCEKINRDDIRVRFYEEESGEVVWEGFGDFGPNDVHRQYAVVFKTPAYKEAFLTKPKDVFMQLQRSSDLEGSDPIQFTYQPEDPDPDRILEKRKRKSAALNFLNTDSGGQGISQEALKQRLKLKATRTASRGKQENNYAPIKEEVMSPIPQYSFNNTGAQGQSEYPMSYTPASAVGPSQPEITASTITASTSLSGGKLQYTPQQNTQTGTQPNLNVQQILGLLQNALMQQAQAPQNPETSSAQAPVQQSAPQLNPPASNAAQSVDLTRLFQTLQNASAGNNENRGFNQNIVSQNDPNLQQTQTQDMTSLGSIDHVLQSYMGDSPMVSFDSLGSFSGGQIDFDPNVAQYETVDESSRMSTGTRTDDETMTAINNLNQS